MSAKVSSSAWLAAEEERKEEERKENDIRTRINSLKHHEFICRNVTGAKLPLMRLMPRLGKTLIYTMWRRREHARDWSEELLLDRGSGCQCKEPV